MSGGVGPCSDIRLPEDQAQEQEHHAKVNQDASLPKKQHHHKQPPHPQQQSSLLTFRQLNALATVVVMAASGMVSAEDLAFVLFSLAYMYFMSSVAFPSLTSTVDPPVFGRNNRLLGLYVSVGAVIGLFLPIAYIFEGIFSGDKEGIKAAAPHVFLLASQVFMEGVSFNAKFSLPIRVFVPVFYNSRRIFTIMEWLGDEISKENHDYGASVRRLYVGRGLAIANLAFWCFNLFGFLLPVYLPKAFKIYHSGHKLKEN